jgi:hypothetical protein
MKLDKDPMREILLTTELSNHSPEEAMVLSLENRTPQKVSHHMMHLHKGGLLVGENVSVSADTFPAWLPKHLPYNGHEFLDTLPGGAVWVMTKRGAEKTGSASLGLMLELGKAYGKQVLKDRLGIDLP